MKKLTKKSLDELAKTMNVISESEQENYWGMYSGDCLWRCMSYVNSGGTSYSESAAASYALDYFKSIYGEYADAYLTSLGAGMTASQILSYIQTLNSTGTYSYKATNYIILFNTSDISYYEPGSNMHAAVVTSANADGSLNVFDPQLGTSYTMSSDEAAKIKGRMY